MPENDIVLNSKEISKNHMTIRYRNRCWSLLDGSKRRSSVNGTWLSLSDKRQRLDKRVSDAVEVANGDMLMISENHLLFTFYNFK